ncbi:hypothetical protein F5887DRAFT_1249997 [Amanita rubescens]|nr:hypothetical protein F5887DRAFT_1249997 [Amanita rubescens]
MGSGACVLRMLNRPLASLLGVIWGLILQLPPTALVTTTYLQHATDPAFSNGGTPSPPYFRIDERPTLPYGLPSPGVDAAATSMPGTQAGMGKSRKTPPRSTASSSPLLVQHPQQHKLDLSSISLTNANWHPLYTDDPFE